MTAVPCASRGAPGSARARSAAAAKKPITPKQKKVTVLSVVGPARPTPFSASAAGAASEQQARPRRARRRDQDAREGRLTPGNLAHLIGCAADVDSRSPGAGARPGTHRVPADLLQRAPPHRPGAPRLGRPRRRVHRRDPARHDGRGRSSTSAPTSGGSPAPGSASCACPSGSAATRRTSAGSSSSARSRSRSSAFIFKDQIESGARSLYLIGSALILFSFVMLLAEHLGSRRRAARGDGRPRRPLHRRSPRRWPWSRASRARGRRSPPACFAGSTGSPPPATRSCSGAGRRPQRPLRAAQGRAKRANRRSAATVIATLVAFVTGYAAIAWLLRYLGTHSLRIFVDLPHRPRHPGPGPDRGRRDQLIPRPIESDRCGQAMRAAGTARPPGAKRRTAAKRTARGRWAVRETREESREGSQSAAGPRAVG